jgi:hypothetical protein
MPRSSLLAVGVLAGAGIGWLVSQGAGAELVHRLGAGDAPATVTVVLVQSPEAVSAVRDSIARERIVAQSPYGFAVREGRIVTLRADAAGELIGSAGWTDARIEIVKPGASDAARSASALGTSGRDAELSALRRKPTLTQAEAARALQLLE